MTERITINNQTFLLHSSGAMYWEEKDLLVISDVHLGKISHFRKYGSAIPPKAVAGNFKKLQKVLEEFEPATLCFLGDLFHSAINQEWRLFEEWSRSVSAEIVLVEGNHDIISPLKYEALGVKMVPELKLGEFLLTHHPEERAGWFNFSGHLHPGVKLRGLGRQMLKLPCFFKTSNQMILPAFGEFTGKYILKPDNEAEVFVIAKDKVMQLPIAKGG